MSYCGKDHGPLRVVGRKNKKMTKMIQKMKIGGKSRNYCRTWVCNQKIVKRKKALNFLSFSFLLRQKKLRRLSVVSTIASRRLSLSFFDFFFIFLLRFFLLSYPCQIQFSLFPLGFIQIQVVPRRFVFSCGVFSFSKGVWFSPPCWGAQISPPYRGVLFCCFLGH